ncbi:class I SAM-dependent methyltransferase [uncultured Thiodictyon sp.]|uniref:class I SAM-dependent methyltransferase n=1 Tax=uncultured Thiodictyon sp. TaxID=1846217 RepID=UPI0025FB79C4|nr:class I SAM-dependent methyltransferase [uncultured Thiodictyon sp.]
MEINLIPRARRLVERLGGLPFSAWPHEILDASRRIASPPPPALPENFRRLPHDAETIARDVDYAVFNAQAYRGFLEQAGDTLDGAWLLELGPGRNFGVMLTLACMGARVAVADRFLAPWEDDYHGRFYAALRQRIDRESIGQSLAPLDAVIAARDYPSAVLMRTTAGGEDLSAFSDGQFDAVFSNAVFEHVRDHARVFAELWRLTRPGGYGSHQVDFRDHRALERPLELLLLAPKRYRRTFDEYFGECGCQLRPREMSQLFECAGFHLLTQERPRQVDEAYFAGFLPRLRASRSAYREWPAEALRDLEVRYVVRKPS